MIDATKTGTDELASALAAYLAVRPHHVWLQLSACGLADAAADEFAEAQALLWDLLPDPEDHDGLVIPGVMHGGHIYSRAPVGSSGGVGGLISVVEVTRVVPLPFPNYDDMLDEAAATG